MASNKIEIVESAGSMIALIIRQDYTTDGIEFFTPPEFSQQLGYMKRPPGYVIEPHFHKIVQREIKRTQEVLLIRRGKIRVDLYDNNQNYLVSKVLVNGDTILLADGGHGFEVIETTEMVEVKQGPYSGDEDKVRFTPLATCRGKTENQPH